uniref:Cuticular protein n=1 Tax=Nilaparvata lugens TaxID=108931 RepID=A0A2S1ZSG1_NILLU|nr:cuticular protein [Nilaparvata lugens]
MFATSTLVATLLGVSLSVASGGLVSTQFHAQDGHGGYSYGHSGGPSSKTETGSAGGVVSGTYSYLDGSGVVQTASYTADPVHGFKVHASNLPTPPPPVPVAPHASAWSPAVHADPHASAWSVPVDRPLGVPVADTPEVAHAKLAHLAAVEHQKLIISSHPYRARRSADPHYGFNYHVTTVHEHPKYVHYPAYYYPYYHYPQYPHHYPEYPLASKPGAPEDVTDTPDVQLAKISHLAAVEHQKALVGAH